MSETTKAQVEGTEVQSEEEADKAPKTVYATKDEAVKAWKPTGKYRVFEIFQEEEGKEEPTSLGFVWGRGYDNAIAKLARTKLGMSASHANGDGTTRTRKPSEAVVKDVLATYTEEQLAALGLARATPAVAAANHQDTKKVVEQHTASKGKGKGGK